MDRGEFRITPIGYVRTGGDGFWLEIDREYRPGLEGLDGFSHLNVFWWCHKFDAAGFRKTVECRKPYRKGPPRIGVFATRSPLRPNPIALSVAPILTIDYAAGLIRIPYIDAEDGTPIVDLKPYHPSVERVRNATVPSWCRHWPKWYEDSADFDWGSEIVHG
jgi:tRNA (adenine37-N6)-methyltransferase